MKAVVLALLSMATGIAIGLVLTKREFAHDNLPIEVAANSPKENASPAATKRGPKAVVVTGERFPFGTMDRNSKMSHVFEIRNEGDATLTLIKGKTTCQCTMSELEKEKLEPGEQAGVTLTWQPRSSDPEFEQSAEIITNDPKRSTLYLSVSGRVTDTVRAERTDVHFHDISANETASASLNIYTVRDTELKIEKFDLSDPTLAPFFNVTFTPLGSEELAKDPQAKGGVKMNIDLKRGMPIGPFEQTILVTTNLNAPATLSIQVIGNVASDILLYGPKVSADKMLVTLGAVPTTAPSSHTVYLIVKGPYRDDTKLRVVSVEPSAEISAKLGEPLRDNPKVIRYPLIIETPAGLSPVNRLSEGVWAQINVAATHPDVKELTIKVRYVVKD